MFSSSSGQRVASSLRLRSASRASDTLMVNFSMAILIRPQPGVDTVRVQLLLIVPGSRATRNVWQTVHSDKFKRLQGEIDGHSFPVYYVCIGWDGGIHLQSSDLLSPA